MFMSHEQSVKQYDNIKTGNKLFERVSEFKHLGTALTNQNWFMKKCLLPFTSESFVILFGIEKYKV